MPSKEADLLERSGAEPGPTVEPADGTGLLPALFARFGDLTRLRHDFPLILVTDPPDGPFAEALSGRIDVLLGEIAPPGAAGERLRRNVLHIEREIRGAIVGKGRGTLASLWDAAAERLVDAGGEPVAADLGRAKEAMRLDGDVLECDTTMPARFVAHAWLAVQERRARNMLGSIDALRTRLSGLVRADLLRSAAGRVATTLRAGVGTTHQGLFDFEAMASFLAGPSGPSGLPGPRRHRIEEALDVLRTERFFGGDRPHAFVFDSLDAALAAYRERLPEVAELVRAIAIAELEIEGRYVEATHDEVFRNFDQARLGPEEIGLTPDYLVCLDAGAVHAANGTSLLAALASGAPLKVVVAIDDPFGLGGHLAETAMGLGDVFVIQSTASHLYAARERVRAAIEYRGPALISVFTGPAATSANVAPYLVAAAAIESRAVPAFTYDPSAGPDWAQRFSLHDNPQPERTWPRHELTYADEAMQRVTDEVAVTPADLALCDPRGSADFARVPHEGWNDGLVPVDAWLAAGSNAAAGSLPFIHAVDDEGRIQRLVVDERLVRAIRRRGDAWRRLRQLDGLKFERGPASAPGGVADGRDAEAPAEAGPADVGIAAEAAAAVEAETPAAAAAEEAAPGEPYIETPRCTTCNECTAINGRMFAYDENRQAFIADPDAGTYRELVEAAESCQVAIIHPGKPRNPGEPGLDELVERAAEFP